MTKHGTSFIPSHKSLESVLVLEQKTIKLTQEKAHVATDK